MGIKMKKWMILALLLPAWTVAQEDVAEPAVSQQQNACATEKHRQFDFWVGEWAVTQGGKPAGNNRIESIHGGCVLAEHWTSSLGNFSGSSLNTYDKVNDMWHQTWVDSAGTLLQLNGVFEDGRMILSGTLAAADGSGKVQHRISWTPNDDGSVRQHWESSTDGEEWTTLFDGLYVRTVKGE
jgi:hypothetical protein